MIRSLNILAPHNVGSNLIAVADPFIYFYMSCQIKGHFRMEIMRLLLCLGNLCIKRRMKV